MINNKTVKFSLAQAQDLAQMAIEEKGGNYVYHRPFIPESPHGVNLCAYYDAYREPSCIIGHILHRLGLLFEPAQEENFAAIRGLWITGVIDVDPVTLNFLAALQNRQDEGHPWALCLAEAMLEVKTPTAEEQERSHA